MCKFGHMCNLVTCAIWSHVQFGHMCKFGHMCNLGFFRESITLNQVWNQIKILDIKKLPSNNICFCLHQIGRVCKRLLNTCEVMQHFFRPFSFSFQVTKFPEIDRNYLMASAGRFIRFLKNRRERSLVSGSFEQRQHL